MWRLYREWEKCFASFMQQLEYQWLFCWWPLSLKGFFIRLQPCWEVWTPVWDICISRSLSDCSISSSSVWFNFKYCYYFDNITFLLILLLFYSCPLAYFLLVHTCRSIQLARTRMGLSRLFILLLHIINHYRFGRLYSRGCSKSTFTSRLQSSYNMWVQYNINQILYNFITILKYWNYSSFLTYRTYIRHADFDCILRHTATEPWSNFFHPIS